MPHTLLRVSSVCRVAGRMVGSDHHAATRADEAAASREHVCGHGGPSQVLGGAGETARFFLLRLVRLQHLHACA